ncbi:MAG TPA: phage capsid protein [Alphaproteobacteria bacterium]|nr:phage capsid protein [Alphaproteobacteria bacterium]
MSVSIDQVFVKQFEADVHLAYQQMGTKLRSTVRSKSGIIGSSTTFQKVGKGTAATKSRHGIVPVMNLNHEPVECLLQDYYAGDWVDSMDELKTNIDERRVVASAGAYALGRKTDELIIDAMNDANVEVGDYTTNLTKDLILSAVEQLNANDVPDDGRRFAVVGVQQWNQLLSMDEFVSSEYVGGETPLVSGFETKKWLGLVWVLHNALPINESGRDCFIYHAASVGHACGQEVKTDISWHGERAAHFISNSMSQGAVLIDADGIVRIKCDETASI